MKNFLLCIITSFFTISCSTDFDNESSLTTSGKTQNSDEMIDSSNPFDFKGKRVYEVLKDYYENNGSPKSISDLAGQISFIRENIHGNKSITNRLIPFTDEMVETILSDPDNSMILIVQNSMLQTHAKSNLIDFLQNLIAKRQEEFAITNNYISGYEQGILNDSVFSSEETETMLTVASISRYSLYSEEERKDKDWDILIGSRPAKPFFKRNDISIILIIALLEKLP